MLRDLIPGPATAFKIWRKKFSHSLVRRRRSLRLGEKSASSPGCAKTPKWHFGRTKKGFSDPSPPKKTRHTETVEVVFPGSPAGEEFSHSLSRRRLQRFHFLTSVT